MGSVSETDTVATALRTAADLVPSTYQGLVIVYQRGRDVLCGVCRPLGHPRGELVLGPVPSGADGAVLIAVCDHDHVISRSINELDALATQVEHARIAVHAEIYVASLRPGDHWTDLLDLDHPGGTVPARTTTTDDHRRHARRWLRPLVNRPSTPTDSARRIS
ncbi:hypothetical protein [Nocardia tengchongensis]|uniref:hypothetical protein n=1 Tax=Nocardia tengchongensis TaxID=2055889 RepID=UPI0036783AF4